MSTVSNKEIASSIYLFFKDEKGSTTEKSQKVVEFLARRRLLGKSEDILANLENIINKDEGILKAKISSAKVVKETEKKEIASFLKQRFGAEKIIFEEFLDPALLGGFKLEVNDEVVDFSIKNKIAKLQEHLIQTT